MDCSYGTLTSRRWLPTVSCYVVECRQPDGVKDFRAFGEANQVNRFRRACDEHFSLIPNADYIMARSGFCNEKDCPLYKRKD